jgi:hypothetical protein
VKRIFTLVRAWLAVAHDGCREVEWKGQAFSYLMHHPGFNKTENYGSSKAAAGAGKSSYLQVCGPDLHSHFRSTAYLRRWRDFVVLSAGAHAHEHGPSSSDVGTRVSWHMQHCWQQ